MPSYVLLIKYDHEGAHLDSCLDVSRATKYGSVYDTRIVETVRRKFGAAPDPELTALNQQLKSLLLRPRFDGACDGPFLVHVPCALERDEIDKLIQDKSTLEKIRQGRIS